MKLAYIFLRSCTNSSGVVGHSAVAAIPMVRSHFKEALHFFFFYNDGHNHLATSQMEEG